MGRNLRCFRTAEDEYDLDSACALIEGHPKTEPCETYALALYNPMSRATPNKKVTPPIMKNMILAVLGIG